MRLQRGHGFIGIGALLFLKFPPAHLRQLILYRRKIKKEKEMIKDRSLLAAVFYNINITLFSVSFYVIF